MSVINKKTLSNGLRIVHQEDKATQMVALNLLYNVGAKDENPSKTGFAHLFEHLMFSGSENIPNYDIPLQNAGGENNAWTNNDLTNFYLTIPYQNVEIGFWLESDRLNGLGLDARKIEIQKGVVCEEFKQRNLNQPYGDASHLVRDMAYQVHPYRWPTIGERLEHIQNASAEDVVDFYHRFYNPNNLILAVTGHISFERTIELAEKWFGDITKNYPNNRPTIIEPKQLKVRRKEVFRDVPVDSLYMAFHMCERKNRDYYAFDILSDILSNGASSRFHQKLILEKRIFTSVDAYISGSIDAGLFQIYGRPYPGVTLEEAEKAILEELELIKKEYVDEVELEKVKNKFESNYIFNHINFLNVATNLAWFELLGDANDINNEVSNYKSVTKEHLLHVANQSLIEENCSILYYKKRENKEIENGSN